VATYLRAAASAAIERPERKSFRAWADRTYARGAIISRVATRPTLLGDFRWEEPDRIFWFAAFGDHTTDARSFVFHHVRIGPEALTFLHSDGGEVSMTAIDHAALDDPDDYRIAWQLWQQVAPLHAAFIRRAYEGLERRGGED